MNNIFRGQLFVDSAEPPISGMQVAMLADLLSLPNNYPHRRVWVISERAEYYLNNGTGALESNWWRVIYRTALIAQYDQELSYPPDAAVYSGTKLYVCIAEAFANELPAETPAKWLCVGGGSGDTSIFNFSGATSFVLNTLTDYPNISIYVGGERIHGHIMADSARVFTVTFSEALTGFAVIK